jgi:ABC-2 type transport system ATP-binding protein
MIEFKNVNKSYFIRQKVKGPLAGIRSFFSGAKEEIKAVQDLSFHIPEGELLGYLGPNGAGKSTTIKMLAGILVPTSGEISVAGITPYKERKKNARNIGAVFGQRAQLWWDLPVEDSYQLNRKLYRISDETFNRNYEHAMEGLGVKDFLDTPVRQLSLGQRMRAEIGGALLHNPRILFLDEPTIGLDVVAKAHIRNFIRDINREFNTTVILTTHDMTDVEEICNRIMIIDRGQSLFDGNLQILREKMGHKRRLRIDWEEDQEFEGLQGVDLIEQKNPANWVLQYNQTKWTSGKLIKRFMDHGPIKDISVDEVPIETVVKNFYEAQGDTEAKAAKGGA